jgi:hypothetical protein
MVGSPPVTGPMEPPPYNDHWAVVYNFRSFTLAAVTPKRHPDRTSYWTVSFTPDGQWAAAYRLIAQRRRLVVAEVRVYPATPYMISAHGAVPPLDPEAPPVAPCPPRGITTRVLRGIRVGQVMASVNAGHRRIAKELPDFYKNSFGSLEVAKPIARGTQKRRGRPPESDLKYARVATAYVEACDAGHHPVKTVATTFKIPPATATVWIQAARRRGLLSETSPGVAGGSLTPRARAVLRKSSR